MDDLQAQLDELRGEVAALRARVEILEGGATCEPPPIVPEEQGVEALAEAFWRSAPPPLSKELAATMEALQEALLGPQKGLAQLVVEIVELCEESRHDGDLSHAFYDTMEERLAQLTEAVGLEPILPAPGTPYSPQEQLVLRSVRGNGRRDTVERCLKRGFRFQGQLLKKEEVTLNL
jgi:hypothetical protein